MKALKVKVKPNAPETKIISQIGDEIILEVKAPAEDNEANIELVKFLSKYFGADVKIIRGLKSKNKIIRLD